eukprot:6507010-Heterocapsa_arctica.AAC.1
MFAITRGTTARRAPEATFAIVSPKSWLDPDLFLTANVIGGWVKKVAQTPELLHIVPDAWEKEYKKPSASGRPNGPVSLLIKKIRELGWTPTAPDYWTNAEGE